MQTASMEPLNIQIHGILKGHGGQREAFVPDKIQERIKIHFFG